MLIIKKYSNRRLYDTTQSRYITLDELAELIRAGHDIRVVDAKTEEDLTQSVLAQIILDSRGAANLLTPQLMMQLIRMEDDALGEFFGQYLIVALQMYQRVRQSARYYYNARYGRPGGYPAQRPGLGAFNPMGQFMQAMMGGGWGSQGGYPGQGGPGDYGQPGGPQGHMAPPQGGYDPHSEPPYGYEYDQPPFPPEAYGQDAGGYSPFEPQYEQPPQPRHAPAPRQQPAPQPPQPQPQAPAPQQAPDPEVARMRAELDELKQLIRATALGQSAPPAPGGGEER